jgi:hypothetical protein
MPPGLATALRAIIGSDNPRSTSILHHCENGTILKRRVNGKICRPKAVILAGIAARRGSRYDAANADSSHQ